MAQSRRFASNQAQSNNSIVTASGFFPDGTLVDLVQDHDGAPLRFLIWSGGTATIEPRFTVAGATHVPPQLHPACVRALRIPQGPTPYTDLRALFTELSDAVSYAGRLAKSTVALIAFHIIATWLSEFLPQSPLLWLVAPSNSCRGSLLKLLSLLCRHGVVVNALSVDALAAFPTGLKPTLLTQVSKVTAAFTKAMHASSRPGILTPVRRELVDLSCARIVLATEALPDPAELGFPFEVALELHDGVAMDWTKIEAAAEQLRSKLMMYRFLSFSHVRVPDFEVPGLPGPARELAKTLGAAIVGDDELRAAIIPLLQPYGEDLEAQFAARLETIIYEALLAACHDPMSMGGADRAISATDIAVSVNTILAGRGKSLEVSPETVGRKLGKLGLGTKEIVGGLHGLKLTVEMRRKIHELAAARGVTTLRESGPRDGCGDCAALYQHGRDVGKND